MFRASGTYNFGVFDLTNGVIITQGGSNLISANIEFYGNGWYRCSITFTAQFSFIPSYFAVQNGSLDYYTGDGTSGIYIWGAQLELGSYPTSYIVSNSGLDTTRVAETANNSGDASTFNDSEGVLMAEISALANDSSTRVITISDGTNNERVQLFYIGSNQIASNVTDGGVGQASMISSVNILNNNKFAFKYKLNDLALWSNGFKVSVDTVATMPTGLNTLSYDNGIGASVFYGNTKQIQYFDSALNDSELETLTSWTSFSEMATSQLYSIQ